MATLKDFFGISETPLNDYIDTYNLMNFVETGTGIGDTVEYCIGYNFTQLYSIEIHPEIAKTAQLKFEKNSNCQILEGNSFDVLNNILPKLKGNTLFWLDAHFPGVDFHYNQLDDTKDKDTRIPLQKELETIVKNRDIKNDMFLIDDLRVYEDGSYKAGNWPHREIYGDNSIQFVYDLLEDTHNIEKNFNYQGFLIITSK